MPIDPQCVPRSLAAALQGGGSHGAFTWGVLDRLLEEERLSFEGISATSAGAVNAVVLADGLAAGGEYVLYAKLVTGEYFHFSRLNVGSAQK